MTAHALPPTDDVLRAFGLPGPAQPLDGGQSQSYTAGDHVLKLVDDPVEAQYCAHVLAKLCQTSTSAFYIPRPIRSSLQGAPFIVSSWTCTEFVQGKPIPRSPDHWKALLDASRAFHAALRDLVAVPPSFLDERAESHRWDVAQRVAFGERPCPTLPPDAIHMLARLKALEPLVASLPEDDLDRTSQLIHGDLAGNVLLLDAHPPAIIDFSPYWRPVAWAEAVVVSDSLVEYGAGSHVVHMVGTGRGRMEMLLKAMVFRVISDWLGGEERMIGMLEKWNAAVDLVRDILLAEQM